MRVTSSLLCAIAFLCALPLTAGAVDLTKPGFYMLNKVVSSIGDDAEEASSFAAQGGYRFSPNFRLEGGLDYHRNDYRNEAPIIGSAFSGDTDGFGLLTNAWLDLSNKSGVTPYMGGGMGFNRGSINTRSSGAADFENQSDTAFAWQMGGGAFYNVTERFLLSADYRFTNNTPFSFKSSDHSNFASENQSDPTAHQLRVSARYTF